MALHRFYLKSPSSVFHLVSNFRKRLCDNALCSLFDLVTVDVDSYKDLLVSFVNILKQVVDRGLPKNYDYHQMPAPFIQVKLLKILALLGSGDKKTSQNMYTVLGDIIKKSDSSTNIGNAVLYECIRCVSSIYPNPKLLEAAAHVIEKFLKCIYVYTVCYWICCHVLHVCCCYVVRATIIISSTWTLMPLVG